MNIVMRLLYKWQKRKMCTCAAPTYIVKDKKLYCHDCLKPLHKLDVSIGEYDE